MSPTFAPSGGAGGRLILERGRSVLEIEVKLGQVAEDHDVRHLRWLREELGDGLVDAAIVTTGQTAYRRADGIPVVPAAQSAPERLLPGDQVGELDQMMLDQISSSYMKGGELIRDARRRHGLSQRRLARRSGAGQAWISRVERDEVSPSIDSLERLLLVMGESLSLQAERIGEGDEDLHWREIHRARPMAERLERAFDAASFADELRGTAKAE